ncbi:DUF1304 domain-containing protein [Marisediminicola senii]|uniref:DUF1304 domain-containing protein n=1 Tax=Marisediminicola senii TaxID=2711233 RepID=UPI0013EB2345|nr:DUF1304 domain-containing protein [Marisediminicola senii]
MIVVSFVFAGLAAALHVYVFWMESLAWSGRAARRTFGPATPAEVQATSALAFNQGFYNLFLAIITAAGIVVTATSATAVASAVGLTLLLAGTASMLAAATVLFVAFADKRSAAIRQGVFPLIAVATAIIAIIA